MENSPFYTFTLADALYKTCWDESRAQPEPPLTEEITLNALRNEVTGFQVVVSGAQAYTLILDRTNWLHPLGFKPRLRLDVRFPSLPAGSVEVFAVGYLEGDERVQWTEALIRSGWIESEPGRQQPAFVRLRIPADLKPGWHEGQVIAYAQEGFADERALWQAHIHLDVSPVTLPKVHDYAFHLNLWQHLTSIARYYRVSLWSDAHFALIEAYYQSLAQLGQKAVSIIAAEIPWSGQRCYRDANDPAYLFEHAIIGCSRDPDGKLNLDFTHLDRLLRLANRYGLDREIDLFGLLNVWVDEDYGFGKVITDAPDAVRVRCYDERRGAFGYLKTADDLRAYLQALHEHFAVLGLLDRVQVAADEPADLEQFNKSLAFLKAAAPGFHYNAAINHFEFIEAAPPEVSDFVPVLPLACREPGLTNELTGKVHRRGGKMLWYICCWPPLPNTFLHSPLYEGRLIGWLTHYLNLDGFLRWAFCLWNADPWKRATWRYPGWSAGDMYFVLPGNDGRPVETLRYEALRMAVQDYELLRLARQRLSPETAEAAFERAFAHIIRANAIEDFAEVGSLTAQELYSLDPGDYRLARQEIIRVIVSPEQS